MQKADHRGRVTGRPDVRIAGHVPTARFAALATYSGSGDCTPSTQSSEEGRLTRIASRPRSDTQQVTVSGKAAARSSCTLRDDPPARPTRPRRQSRSSEDCGVSRVNTDAPRAPPRHRRALRQDPADVMIQIGAFLSRSHRELPEMSLRRRRSGYGAFMAGPGGPVAERRAPEADERAKPDGAFHVKRPGRRALEGRGAVAMADGDGRPGRRRSRVRCGG